ncbi:MAG: hypothetical protein ACR2F6_12845 [Mycobacteriales bacterium]
MSTARSSTDGALSMSRSSGHDTFAVPVGFGSSAHLSTQTRTGRPWMRFVFPGMWLIYLIQPGTALDRNTSPGWAILGWVGLVAFAACYLLAIRIGFHRGSGRTFWLLLAAMAALLAWKCPWPAVTRRRCSSSWSCSSSR